MPASPKRFVLSAADHYFEPLPDLIHFEAYIHEKICSTSDKSCQGSARLLQFAQYIDIDYDTVSHSLTISIFHAGFPGSGLSSTRYTSQIEQQHQVQQEATGWEERIEDFGGSLPTEVGIFSNEKPTQPDELSLSGFLLVIGKDKKPSMLCLDLGLGRF